MTTVKRAVTIDEEVDRAARELAGPSFSAFVNEALKRQVRAARLDALLERDAAERGPLDARDVDRVARALDQHDRA